MNSNTLLYPWQEKNWLDLMSYYQAKRVPHALLMHGINGIGMLNLAIYFAKFLLCQNHTLDNRPCETCKSCLLFNANNHPDYVLIQPEDVGKSIKIEQIRQIIHEIDCTSHQGGNRIIIINNAENMNKASANALLKTLEEPESNSIIILITENISLLLPTIRSRCQKMICSTPNITYAIKWLKQNISKNELNFNEDELFLSLKLSENAPLKALQFLQTDTVSLCYNLITDITKSLTEKTFTLNTAWFADKYINYDIKTIVKLFWYIIQDIYKIRQNIPIYFIIFAHYLNEMQKISNNLPNNDFLSKYLENLAYIQNALNTNIAINKNLLLEKIWLGLNQI